MIDPAYYLLADFGSVMPSFMCSTGKGGLVVAPRRAGKSIFLKNLAKQLGKATILTLNHSMLYASKGDSNIDYIIPMWLPDHFRGKNTENVLLIDNIEFIWDVEKYSSLVPWERVICATTSTLDFGWLKGFHYPDEIDEHIDWIKNIVIVTGQRY